MGWRNSILIGDVRERLRDLPDGSVQTVVTSPPYWGLRDYGTEGQIGLEPTPEAYVCEMVTLFREVRRVLADDGTVWLNLGDSYFSLGGQRTYGSSDNGVGRAQQAARRGVVRWQAGGGSNFTYIGQGGQKQKDLVGIPWMVAFALRADGWYLRSDIIWSKPNPMPESVTDRPTKAHEYIFLLSKSATYYYDHEAIKEPTPEDSGWAKQRARGVDTWLYNGTPERVAVTGQEIDASTFGTIGSRNKRSVWEVATKPYKEAHFATYPSELIKPCILAGSREGDVVLDPFLGSGTTAMVALIAGRDFVGIELNPNYAAMAERRIAKFKDRLL